ncbi:hypothetical protein [Agaribacter flavus]|uniref:Uncharacterized protein n=1 Tax=Agaribacter flavus TaxID=1902781 RepID=A0ABV7FTI6_9ALTE
MPSSIVAHQIAASQLVVCIDWLTGKGQNDSVAVARHIEHSTKAICEACLRH